MPTTQFDKESIKQSIIGKLQRYNGRTLADATPQQIYYALASTVKDQIMQKWVLDARLKPWPRRLVKLLIWNAAAGAMLAMIAYVLRLDAIMAEYREMGRVSLVGFALLANLTLALYDRLLGIVAVLYVKKLRPKWMKGT